MPKWRHTIEKSVVLMQMNPGRRRWLLAVVPFSLLFAQEKKKTIYVDNMEGLELFVEKALLDAEMAFDFIEEAKRPELKAGLQKMHSAYGEIYYKHKLGRNETHR